MFEKLTTIPTSLIVLYSAVFIISVKFLFDFVLFIAFTIKQKEHAYQSDEIPVSVIICARNEAQNLKNHLPIICEQNYTNYEVIVVNDASEDDTEQVLKSFDEKYRHFRHTNIPKDKKFEHNKKLALTIGIKATQFPHILLTDADCVPAGKNWIKEMAHKLSHKQIVLGYGAYKKEKSLLNRFIRFDTLSIARSYLSSAKIGLPYMGVGRNLAYHREIYDKARGFSTHYYLNSGDDDLLVNQMARRKNTTVCINPEAFTYSNPKSSFKKWFLQKRRHLTAGVKYRFLHKVFLAFDNLLKFLTWPLLIIIALFSDEYAQFIYIFIGTFIAWHLFAWKIIMTKMKEKGFLFLIPFFEIFISILPIIILIKNFVKFKQSQWK